MKIIELLQIAEERLAAAKIDTPRLDAEVLLAFALGVDRAAMWTERQGEVAPDTRAIFNSYLKRRTKREPVAYIRGFKEFYSIDIKVGRGALIPRPETEQLVDIALDFIKRTGRAKVLDICTGSACIPLAILHNCLRATVTAADISEKALELARQNLAPFGDRAKILKGGLFEPVTGEKFDLITVNPPYCPSGEYETLAKEIYFEPRMAIDGGKDGLDLCLPVINTAWEFLESGGLLLLECGPSTAKKLFERASAMKERYEGVKVIKDYAGLERVVECTKMSSPSA